jgi:hypothetical protein
VLPHKDKKYNMEEINTPLTITARLVLLILVVIQNLSYLSILLWKKASTYEALSMRPKGALRNLETSFASAHCQFN